MKFFSFLKTLKYRLPNGSNYKVVIFRRFFRRVCRLVNRPVWYPINCENLLSLSPYGDRFFAFYRKFLAALVRSASVVSFASTVNFFVNFRFLRIGVEFSKISSKIAKVISKIGFDENFEPKFRLPIRSWSSSIELPHSKGSAEICRVPAASAAGLNLKITIFQKTTRILSNFRSPRWSETTSQPGRRGLDSAAIWWSGRGLVPRSWPGRDRRFRSPPDQGLSAAPLTARRRPGPKNRRSSAIFDTRSWSGPMVRPWSGEPKWPQKGHFGPPLTKSFGPQNSSWVRP